MTSFTCHVTGVAKQVRLERFVRLTHLSARRNAVMPQTRKLGWPLYAVLVNVNSETSSITIKSLSPAGSTLYRQQRGLITLRWSLSRLPERQNTYLRHSYSTAWAMLS